MPRTMLTSRIHRAAVTHVDLPDRDDRRQEHSSCCHDDPALA